MGHRSTDIIDNYAHVTLNATDIKNKIVVILIMIRKGVLTMKCNNCGITLHEGHLYCGICGFKIEPISYCNECKIQLPINSKFCSYCGKSILKSNKEINPSRLHGKKKYNYFSDQLSGNFLNLMVERYNNKVYFLMYGSLFSSNKNDSELKLIMNEVTEFQINEYGIIVSIRLSDKMTGNITKTIKLIDFDGNILNELGDEVRGMENFDGSLHDYHLYSDRIFYGYYAHYYKYVIESQNIFDNTKNIEFELNDNALVNYHTLSIWVNKNKMFIYLRHRYEGYKGYLLDRNTREYSIISCNLYNDNNEKEKLLIYNVDLDNNIIFTSATKEESKGLNPLHVVVQREITEKLTKSRFNEIILSPVETKNDKVHLKFFNNEIALFLRVSDEYDQVYYYLYENIANDPQKKFKYKKSKMLIHEDLIINGYLFSYYSSSFKDKDKVKDLILDGTIKYGQLINSPRNFSNGY